MPGRRRKFHWKHGWIPLTHQAALQKAHGDESQAADFRATRR